MDLSSGITQILDKGFGFRTGCAVAAGENEMTRTRLDKPISQDLAESAERARDQITSVRFDLELRRDGLAAPGQKRLRERDDDFSDVLATGHESEGRVDIERRESAERKRTQGALLHQIGHLGKHVARQRFVAGKDRVHRDDVKRCVAAQRSKRNTRVLINVAFADLDEAAELGETREAHGNRFASERVQDNIDATATGKFHDGFHKITAARVDHVFYAERGQQGALNWTARTGDDFRAEMMRNLDRCHAHATCTGVNKNALALSESRDIFQRMPRGHKHDWNRR